ncbi:DNA-binding response regulator [candidate division WWE3 bacterium CG_4_9_14_3_um_filter_34_6]|uniref:DNA-binding response regulator n=1 Tax=candidate division WWE3 bacterium CG_4_9_14_3_um_filter_34_6 TaxID=1975079 RepID=A0A2M7X3J0_UNCKA|nr:MAG: DNA-binding response regulator [candidate division WWE3 bacterium CG_4_9_14_3_um_filter_34_6]
MMKVLIIDDDPRVVRTLERLLKEEYIVNVAMSAEAAEEIAYNTHHDIILLDLILPDMDGEDLCALLKARLKTTPIIILSAKSNVSDKDVAFRRGADDYITKPFSGRELRFRISAQLRKAEPAPQLYSKTISLRGLSIDRSRKIVTYKNTRIMLRKKELMLLEFFILNKGRVVTRGEILEHVWDVSISPFTNSVDVHVKRLRDKIEKPFDEIYIETVHGIGYLME